MACHFAARSMGGPDRTVHHSREISTPSCRLRPQGVRGGHCYPLFRSCSRRTGSRAYFSTITIVGTPQDAMLQEVRVESFVPADDATAQRTWINAD
jgi:hypothetical protein